MWRQPQRGWAVIEWEGISRRGGVGGVGGVMRGGMKVEWEGVRCAFGRMGWGGMRWGGWGWAGLDEGRVRVGGLGW